MDLLFPESERDILIEDGQLSLSSAIGNDHGNTALDSKVDLYNDPLETFSEWPSAELPFTKQQATVGVYSVVSHSLLLFFTSFYLSSINSDAVGFGIIIYHPVGSIHLLPFFAIEPSNQSTI